MLAFARSALILCLPALLPSAFSQAIDKHPDLPARLQQTIQQTSLDTPNFAPWHLKLSVQLFPSAKGTAPQSGTIEVWWDSPTQFRVQYDFPDYHAAILHSGTRQLLTPGTTAPPWLPSLILNDFVHPMPSPDELASATPDLRTQKFGSVPLDCVMLDKPIKGYLGYLPLGLFPTYCLDPGKPSLRISFEFGSQTTTRQRVGTFRGRFVPIDLALSVDDVPTAKAHLEVLEGNPKPYPEALDSTGLEEQPTQNVALIGSGVMKGAILTRQDPVYPEDARKRHISGTVVLHAIIGQDGHIRQLTPVSIPDPSLAIAAIQAVRHWTYKPYLLKGFPTEVDTTITVNFNLAP